MPQAAPPGDLCWKADFPRAFLHALEHKKFTGVLWAGQDVQLKGRGPAGWQELDTLKRQFPQVLLKGVRGWGDGWAV